MKIKFKPRFILYPIAKSIEKMLRRQAEDYMQGCPRHSLGYEHGYQLHGAANLIKCWLHGYNGPKHINGYRIVDYPLKQIAEDNEFINKSWELANNRLDQTAG
jgi:hypothetical protein